jgi:hypothetical protein
MYVNCKLTNIAAATFTAGLCLVVATSVVRAAEIVLVTTAVVELIMRGLILSYEHATGNTVKMSVYGTRLAVRRVRESTDRGCGAASIAPAVRRLDPHEPHRLVPHGLADCRSIGRIVLVAFEVSLDVLRQHQRTSCPSFINSRYQCPLRRVPNPCAAAAHC